MAGMIFFLLNAVYQFVPVIAVRLAERLYRKNVRLTDEMSEMLFMWLCEHASCDSCGWFVTHSATDTTCRQCQELAADIRSFRLEDAAGTG